MGSGSISRLARARIMPPEAPLLFPAPPELIRNIITPGRRHLARSRIWRIGRVRSYDDRVVARLGWETEEDTDLYDPGVEDFKHEAVLRGRIVTFAVRLADLAVVYERRRGGMSEKDFTSGLRIVLRAFDGHRRWEVVPVDTKSTFAQWAAGVDLVSRFRFRAEGSDLKSAGSLRTLLRPRPGVLTIDLRSGDGIDVRDEALQELIQLAEAGAGEILAVGRRIDHDAAGIRKAWESASSAERVVLEVPVGEDDSEAVNEARLLSVFSTVPDSPSW